MKRLRVIFVIGILLLLVPAQAFAQESDPLIPSVPTGGNVVLDQLNWLTSAQEKEINVINQKLDKDGIAQIAVVTLNDCGGDKQKFRNELFRAWGIGHSDDNDGLLILVCWYDGDKSRRSVEQETGYGLEGVLPDVLTARVAQEEFVPAFQANRPGDGLVEMVKRYDEILHPSAGKLNPSQPKSVPTPAISLPSLGATMIALLAAGTIGILPGFIWANSRFKVYEKEEKRARRKKKRQPQAIEDAEESTLPNLDEFAAHETIVLIPLLVIGFIYLVFSQSIYRPFEMLVYVILLFWTILLILYLVRNNPWFTSRSDNERWNSDGSDWGNWGDSGGSSFGGGDSGGGGSSSKF